MGFIYTYHGWIAYLITAIEVSQVHTYQHFQFCTTSYTHGSTVSQWVSVIAHVYIVYACEDGCLEDSATLSHSRHPLHEKRWWSAVFSSGTCTVPHVLQSWVCPPGELQRTLLLPSPAEGHTLVTSYVHVQQVHVLNCCNIYTVHSIKYYSWCCVLYRLPGVWEDDRTL